ncbi:MAG TPA: hypothetical protein VEV81_09635, partial [Pyrinomonadaceae bacterium]|nr:hypothetical protein [Pyrinomonadaceae bacterium]
MNRKSPLVVLLLIFSLLAPMSGAFRASAQGQTRPGGVGRIFNKLSDDLRDRARQQAGSPERTRVILNLSDPAAKDRARQILEANGASVRQQLDALDVLVADVPVSKLEALSLSDEISWMSGDQPVRSLATSTDNTSHIEVTTGASKILPPDSTKMADGGGGNKVGIAIVDSGISPADAAEFVGYQKQQSSGLLGLGLTSTTYIQTYNRIVKSVDFTG